MISKSFSATVLVLLAIERFSIAWQETTTVCPVNSQDYILGNRDILPFENIIAPSEDSNNNPSQGFVDTTSSVWCTAEGQGAAALGNYIELIFTESVVVEFLKSEGRIDTWVSNFSIHYSLTESGDNFMKYGVLKPSQSFIVESIITSTGYFSLERPIVARRLRFVINNGIIDATFGRFCWRIQLFGCLQSRAQQIPSLPSDTDLTPTSTVTAATSVSVSHSQSLLPSTPATDCPPTNANSFSSQEILIIVLSTATTSVVIVFIIAFLSILICVCVTRSTSKESMNVTESTYYSTINEVYGTDDKHDNVGLQTNECYSSTTPPITSNEAYGIIDKHDNIDLQTNQCYRPVEQAPISQLQDEGMEYT